MYNEVKTGVLTIIVGIVSVVVVGFCLTADAADITYDNGAIVYVPEAGWRIDVVPKGLNTLPFDSETNPTGKLPGWGGWPAFDARCPNVQFSPRNPSCERVEIISWGYAPEPQEKRCEFYDSGCDGHIDWGVFAGQCYDQYASGFVLIDCP